MSKALTLNTKENIEVGESQLRLVSGKSTVKEGDSNADLICWVSRDVVFLFFLNCQGDTLKMEISLTNVNVSYKRATPHLVFRVYPQAAVSHKISSSDTINMPKRHNLWWQILLPYCLYRFTCYKHFHKQSHNRCSFVAGFFHIACFQDSLMLQPESAFHTISWPNNILFHTEYTTCYLSSSQLAYVFSTFGLW